MSNQRGPSGRDRWPAERLKAAIEQCSDYKNFRVDYPAAYQNCRARDKLTEVQACFKAKSRGKPWVHLLPPERPLQPTVPLRDKIAKRNQRLEAYSEKIRRAKPYLSWSEMRDFVNKTVGEEIPVRVIRDFVRDL